MKLYGRVNNVSFDNVNLGKYERLLAHKMVVEGKLAIGGFYLYYPLQGLVCRDHPEDFFIIISVFILFLNRLHLFSSGFSLRMPADSSFLFICFLYSFILSIYSIFVLASLAPSPFPVKSEMTPLIT